MERIQEGGVGDRQIISDFIIPNHLAASARNEKELKVQTDDLPTDFPDLFSDEIFAKGSSWKVEEQGKVIAAIGLTPYTENPEIIYLSFFGVSEACRGTGLGKLLLEKAIARAREQGFKAIRLTTLPGIFSAACHLYAKYGFKEISATQTECYYVAIFELIL